MSERVFFLNYRGDVVRREPTTEQEWQEYWRKRPDGLIAQTLFANGDSLETRFLGEDLEYAFQTALHAPRAVLVDCFARQYPKALANHRKWAKHYAKHYIQTGNTLWVQLLDPAPLYQPPSAWERL